MKCWFTLCLALFAGLLLNGCGKKSDSSSSANANAAAFQTATPELKAAWDGAAASLQTNNYVDAFMTLRQLGAQPGLTPQQVEAIAAQTGIVQQRMTDAAQKGDAKALQAFDEIRKASRSTGR